MIRLTFFFSLNNIIVIFWPFWKKKHSLVLYLEVGWFCLLSAVDGLSPSDNSAYPCPPIFKLMADWWDHFSVFISCLSNNLISLLWFCSDLISDVIKEVISMYTDEVLQNTQDVFFMTSKHSWGSNDAKCIKKIQLLK